MDETNTAKDGCGDDGNVGWKKYRNRFVSLNGLPFHSFSMTGFTFTLSHTTNAVLGSQFGRQCERFRGNQKGRPPFLEKVKREMNAHKFQ